MQAVKRVTLHRLMPDLGSTLSLLFTKLEIQEPTFTDLVIVYRKSKAVLDRAGSDKDQLPNWSKGGLVAHAVAAGREHNHRTANNQ